MYDSPVRHNNSHDWQCFQNSQAHIYNLQRAQAAYFAAQAERPAPAMNESLPRPASLNQAAAHSSQRQPAPVPFIPHAQPIPNVVVLSPAAATHWSTADKLASTACSVITIVGVAAYFMS